MRALIRFYVRGAARIAQRNALVTFALAILALIFVPEAPRMARLLVMSVTASDSPHPPAVILALLAITAADGAAKTLRVGVGGWLRSLPFSAPALRRAFAVALVVPLAPILAYVLIGIALTPTRFGHGLHVPSLLGFSIGLLGAAAAAVPTQRRMLARPIAWVAALAWVMGTWWAAAASACALLAWDRVAGPVAPQRRRPERTALIDRWILPRLSFRALGSHALYPILIGGLLLGAAWLYRVNNGFARPEAALATRLALLSAFLLGNLVLAERLLERRRRWPWARSLPISSRRRVQEDATVFAVPHLPALLLATALDPVVGLVGVASLPAVSLLSAGALRRTRGRLTGASGVLFWSLAPFVAFGSAWPWMAAVALASTPWALTHATRAEQRWIATAWDPLHHDTAGDSLSEVYR
ncbi:MAG: hypothetical protein R3E97_11400 [Candidatus Eisenbacteria bacterium]